MKKQLFSLILLSTCFASLGWAQTPSKTTGEINLLIVRVNFADKSLLDASEGDLTDEKLKTYWFDPESNLGLFFKKASFGKATLKGQVVTVDLPLRSDQPPADDACLVNQVLAGVTRDLWNRGITAEQFDKVGLFYPPVSGCGLNLAQVNGEHFWIQTIGSGYVSIWAHEFLHTLGLDHVGAPFSNDPIWSQVQIPKSLDWDYSNLLGTTYSLSYLNSNQLSYLKWISPDETPILKRGIGTIRCLAETTQNTPHPLALKVSRNNGVNHYSINYRCPVSYDQGMRSPYYQGVSINADHVGFVTEAGQPDYNSASATKQIGVLQDHQAMLDAKNNLEIIQLSHTLNTATVLVRTRSSAIPGKFSQIVFRGKIKNKANSKCMVASQYVAVQKTCGTANTSIPQRWKVELFSAEPGYVNIKNIRNKTCLTRQDKSAGMAPCVDSFSDQRWRIESDSQTGAFRIINFQPGDTGEDLCLRQNPGVNSDDMTLNVGPCTPNEPESLWVLQGRY